VIVVDANVLAYLYLPCRYTSAVEALLESDPDWVAPVLWRSEFRNALAGHLRRGGLTIDQACRLQGEAEELMHGSEYDVDSASVLRLAAESACSSYDCEYVALAAHLGVGLVTMDKQVLQAFPHVARALE
jgi:predicted nucleic acid-binding protein